MEASGDKDAKRVEIIVSKSIIGHDVTEYGYVVGIGSQDGFGTGGFRDIDPEAGTWRVGGGELPNGQDGIDYDPSFLDLILDDPMDSQQESILSDYDVDA